MHKPQTTDTRYAYGAAGRSPRALSSPPGWAWSSEQDEQRPKPTHTEPHECQEHTDHQPWVKP